MKKRFTLLFIFLTFCSAIYAQCPPTGDIHLKNQADVNAFCTGGASNCTINGNLKIEPMGGGATITDLSSLTCIVAVTGELKVKKCDVTSLTGLGNITSVGASLKIEDNPVLTSLNGLQSISGSLSKELKISGNTLLTSIAELSGITGAATDLKIENNPALTSLNGLQNISGPISHDLKIKGNTLLTSIAELSSITSVGNNLEIDGNPALATLNGLQGITSVVHDIKIINNTILGSTGEEDCISIPAGICTAVNNGGWHKITYSDNNSNDVCDLSETEVEDACALAPLPVELIDFRAKEDQQQNVVLLWATESESNNMHFVIERAVDGRTFEMLETVNGNGTTNLMQNYSYVDTKPIAFAYYRLKQVDYDGSFEYSNVIFWEMKKTQNERVVAFPTLAENEINLRFTTFETKKSLLKIVSSYGKVMHEEVVYSSNLLEYRKLDLTHFENGIYSIILSDGFNNSIVKFVVSKTY